MKPDTSQVGISIAIPALDGLGFVRYAFTTRQNGLGARTEGVRQPDDWKTVAKAFGIDSERLVTVNQVHGEDIVVVDDKNFMEVKAAKADALVTGARGIAVGVETADCVPILLIDPEKPAVAAVHAGWRSTVKNIAQKAVEKMRIEFGSDPGKIIAAIGPAIGPECYEVDEPVMSPVRENFSFWREVASPRGNDRWSLDLVKLNRLELVRARLHEINVYSFGLCTSCLADLFYSYRREGRTGRMLSVVMIKS
ncbi:MAG TPA: peptidoglycan editing factor PgeF [Nitrospirota bacterium]|nr:peptidoglycan editing factor PgeF [Nitrospirota bacterium]